MTLGEVAQKLQEEIEKHGLERKFYIATLAGGSMLYHHPIFLEHGKGLTIVPGQVEERED